MMATQRLMGDVAAGAVAGTVATVPMSAVMWAAQQVGLIHKQPPEEITEAALRTAGAHSSEHEQDHLSVVNHLLFGAVAGGLFGASHRALPGAVAVCPRGSCSASRYGPRRIRVGFRL